MYIFCRERDQYIASSASTANFSHNRHPKFTGYRKIQNAARKLSPAEEKDRPCGYCVPECARKARNKTRCKTTGRSDSRICAFYFAPRSPMLGAINLGRVEGCPYRQEDIVHFETTAEAVIEKGLTFVFYDYNATLDYADCYNDLRDLDKIDWELFYEAPQLDGYCAFWFSRANIPRYIRRMETRQAEFLVHEGVPLNLMSRVGVSSEKKAAEVQELFEQAKIDIPVQVKTDWYF